MDHPEQVPLNSAKLELHPEAKKNYDERGEALLLEVSATPFTQPGPGFRPDMPIAATFAADQIFNMQQMSVLPNGMVLERTFSHGGKTVGLKDESYKKFARLCEKMQKGNPIRTYVSVTTIEKYAFNWIKDRYTGTSSSCLTDYIFSKCESLIREYEIWIPIYHTHVPHDLPFGEVTVKTFTETMFNALRDYNHAHSLEDEKFIPAINEFQRRYQSMAAATMFVEAEPKRAYEIALEQADKAVAILRIYSQAAFIPEIMSCCVLMGQKEAQYEAYFVFHEGQLHSSFDGHTGAEQTTWVIGPDHIDVMNMSGIGAIVNLFFNKDRTPFENDVFQSMMIYSRGLAALTPSDKLMYIFSALETLLLKNNTEPIGANIPRRVAFVVAEKARDRKKVIVTYGRAYELRSQFVHHGQSVDDFELLTEFLQIVFRFFLGLVHRELEKYKNTVDFLDALELLSLGGE